MIASDIKHRGRTGVSLPLAALIVALGCGSSPSAPRVDPTTVASPSPSPPSPPPPSVTYRVSGMVADENGSPKPGAHVDMWYSGPDDFTRGFRLYTAIRKGTNAGADGRYEFSFETDQQQFLGNPNLVGIVRSGNDVQLLPGGVAQIVRNMRHHAVETIAVGQSITVSISPDSSRGLDNFPIGDGFGTSNPKDFSHVQGAFRVQIPRSGTLTVLAAGSGATLRGFCYYGPEECDYAPLTSSPGTLTGQVLGGTIYEIGVSIPVVRAPQQYLVTTSLD